MNSLISIIIPTFNRSSLVLITLNSIINQTYRNWECIIVDDGSDYNNFLEIENYSKKDKRFKLFKRPINVLKGANSCRNFGIKQSKGEFLIFFDSDDLMNSICLENRINFFNKYSEYDFLVFSMGGFIKKSNCYPLKDRKVVNLSNKKTIEEFIFSKRLPWNVCRPIFKSSLIRNRIWFNENIQNFQDDEFNVRVLANLKPNYKSIDFTDSYYRMESSNINKYNNNVGKQNLLNSFFEYSKTIFYVLENSQVIQNRDKLILKFFSILRFNISKESNLINVNRTISLFKDKIKLTRKEMFLLKSMIYLNKYYFNKKGYYILTQYIEYFFVNTK
ncbi:glycosyltransferase family 2 protein [Polaribacter sp. Z022]|uniref:glycosyltransferase family 2 protein n=1 Tax=Polaribacter sp. Z022 TaxID=2927125 RepID=UPI002020165C|nr:glycosyltransferase family 2 protein [Polaribacter sp. Z022]MCL7753184.1 glycosyltransferase [Polaribacter sp. Z022]